MSYTFTLAEHELEAELKKLIVQEADKADDVDMMISPTMHFCLAMTVRSVWIRLMRCKSALPCNSIFKCACRATGWCANI